MRLIDADALEKSLEKLWNVHDDQDFANKDVWREIENAPTIEPERTKGKWVVTSEFEDCRYVKCNQCKVTQVFYYNKPLTNFCPNCGADMRSDDE